MRLYFGGGEIGSHRAILQGLNVQHIALSYMGLRRRTKFSRPWLIEDKFDQGVSVFLDSGAYTINSDSEDHDLDELNEIFEHYKKFVTENIDHLEMVSEFDALPLGQEWIEYQRDAFWRTIPREKFMVVWHPVWGIPYLHELSHQYEIIGIPATSLEGRNLRPILNALAAKGTRIHGIAMTKIEEMQSIRWDSVASTSWISPQRFGDTIVWTGKELKRYPRKYKETARKRHRTLFREKGFDAEAIANDDPTEVLRLSAWSWQQFEGYVNKHHKSGNVVTPLFSSGPPPKVENTEDVVDTPGLEPGNDVPTEEPEETPTKAVAKRREPDKILPGMGVTMFSPNEDDEEENKQPLLNIRSESSRVCNTCFLAEKCPGYEPDSNCVYNIPITIRTREQIKALRQGMLEMQAQRVLFMRLAEEVEGGYADPNLTKEIAVLNKMTADYEEAEREGFEVSLRVRGQGSGQHAEGGMFSRLFGNEAGQRVQQIEGGPVQADDVIDAEWTEETEA